MFFNTLLIGAGLVDLSIAGYVLQDNYNPSNFFSQFDFFTGRDPTNGYVTYTDQGTAQNAGLINTLNNAAYIGVDYINVASGSGRASVRLTSKKSYNSGLVIADIQHMPGGICGTWPAFWMVGPNWPNGGEIDIIEGVNDQSANDMTLHTNAGCSISNNGAFTGTMTTPNCDVNAPGQGTNAGCQITTGDTNTYGSGFNAIGGGVYATLWNSAAISIYFFPRGQIPGDIQRQDPDPASWGRPLAQFQGGCDIDAHFQNLQIIFDTTFCGDWAGNTWSSSSCASRASSCTAFVQNNPGAFTDAFWSVNSVKVYQATPGMSAKSMISSESDSAAESVASSVPSSSAFPSVGSSVVPPLTSAQPTASPATTAAVDTPSSSAMITSAKPAVETVSAMDVNHFHNSGPATATVRAMAVDDFPSHGETQTQGQGVKPRSAKMRHGGHLLQHRKRAGGAGALL